MNWANGLTWLSALKARRASRHVRGPDPAEMGTAFGLDASFGPVESTPLRATLPPHATQPWEHRLTRRSSL